MGKYKKREHDEFIDIKVNNCIPGFRNEHNEEYDSIKGLIDIFRLCEDEIEKKGVTQQNLYVMASIMQLNKLYQSAVILLERGLKESAYVIIRTILDLTFRIIQVIKDDKYIDVFHIDQQYEIRKCLNEIKTNSFFDIVPKDKLEALMKKCNEEINGSENPKIKAYDLAVRNGFNKEYILYRLQCDYTHHSNSVIEGIIKVTEQGFFIDGNFQLDDFKESVAWLISITTIIFPTLLNEYIKNKTLKIKYNEFTKTFEKNFKDLLDNNSV